MKRVFGISVLLGGYLASSLVTGFVVVAQTRKSSTLCHRQAAFVLPKSSTVNDDWEAADIPIEEPLPTDVELFLKKKFPGFLFLLQKNEAVMKAIRSSDASDGKGEGGLTLFAPNADALAALGAKRLAQLEDERNLETCEKIAAYHVVTTEVLPASRLFTEDWTRGRPKDGSKPAFTVEGVNTMGGIIPVGGKTGNAPVLGTNEAKILQSYAAKSRKWIVHEMTGLVSPELLWRYCDQLRIPGF